MNKLFMGVATLTGTIIGAGFLGIPYVVSKSGFLIGLFWMIMLCLIMLIVNLVTGEIVLSTKTQHHLPGYASKYLGRKTKLIVFVASIFGLYAALIAYLLGEGESFSYLFFGSANYSIYFGLGFWVLMAVFTLGGIREFKKIEPAGVLGVFLVALVLGLINFNKLNFSNLLYSNNSFFFLPFGVVLFAFLGISSIPEMRRVLKNNEKLMKKSIIIGSVIPLLVYIIFTIIVLGLFGQNVSEIATINFGKIVTILGIFTMFTAFLALSLAVQDTYRFDFNMSFKKAWVFAIGIPLVFFVLVELLNLAGFVKLLSLGGSISGGLLGIAILLIHEKIKQEEIQKKIERKPEFKVRLNLLIKIVLIIIFVAGMIYEFI